MTLADARDRLIKAEVLAPAAAGAGFPIWLPYGTCLGERLHELYLEELGRHTGYQEIETPALIDSDAYRAGLAERQHDYGNMYQVDLGGRPMIARPDNLVAASAAIKARQLLVPVVAQNSLYRSVTGALRPLVLDRHVWRATQVVHAPGTADARAAMDLHLRTCSALLTRLGLPTLWVEKPPLPRHSKRSIFAYTCPAEGEVLAAATLFELADELTAGLGLEGAVLDFGFTSRLVACAAALHGDSSGLVCTSSLAPSPVVAGARRPADLNLARQLAAQARAACDRATSDDAPWHKVLRMNQRRGTPVLLLADGVSGSQLVTRIDHHSEALAPDAATAVSEALARHDAILLGRARAVLDAAIAAERAVRVAPVTASAPGWHLTGRLLAIGCVADTVDEGLGFFARRRRQR